MTGAKKYGMVIGFVRNNRVEQIHITPRMPEKQVMDDLPLMRRLLERNAASVVEDLRSKGVQQINYIHLGLISNDHQSYELLDIYEEDTEDRLVTRK